MKFWEAMKALEEGKKVRVVRWIENEWLSSSSDYCWPITSGEASEEWELYEEPNTSHRCTRQSLYGSFTCHILSDALTLTYQKQGKDSEHCLISRCPFCAYEHNEVERYEEPEQLLSFQEVVKGLKEDKKFKRKQWIASCVIEECRYPKYIVYAIDGRTANFSTEDFEATDWIEVK